MSGTLLLLTDFSEASRAAETVACGLASALDSKIEVVHVLKLPWEWRLWAESTQQEFPEYAERVGTAERLIQEAAGRIGHQGISVETNLWYNEKIQEIPGLSGVHYDLVVVGTNGRTGWQYILYGSVAEKIMRETHIPVLVVKPFEGDFGLRRILFASSLELETRPALEKLVRLGRQLSVERVYITRVTTPYNFIPTKVVRTAYQLLVEGLDDELLEFVPVNHHSIEDGVAELADELEVDLIALNTSMEKNLTSVFLESIPINLARSVSRPVLALRNP